MAWNLVRALDHRTVAALERRAGEHRRSLAEEMRLILEEAAQWAEADPGVRGAGSRRGRRGVRLQRKE